jgi:hypothetical protein
MWQTAAGRYVFTDWQVGSVWFYDLPITKLGLNKTPSVALDVGGDVKVSGALTSNTIEALGQITVDTNLQLKGYIADPSYNTYIDQTGYIGGNIVDTIFVSASLVTASIAYLGTPFDTSFTQSFHANDTMSYTQSLGTITQDGVYKLTVAGTVGLYGGYTAGVGPQFSFKHTDRLGAYVLDAVTTTSVVTPSFDSAYSYYKDFVFQALNGHTVEYYYASPGVSTTPCTGSFMTTVILIPIMSGSVTGSV